jgi:hypothetical protein
LRRNAARFGITTGKIVGLGKSEGATHWGETIIWDNDDAYFQTDPGISDHLNAVVLLYGLYDNNKFLGSILDINGLLKAFFAPDPSLKSTKGNCIANTRNITTPVLLLQGLNDQVVQSEQSGQLHDSLVAQGKVCELQVDGEWGHAFDNLTSPPYTFTPDGLYAKDLVLSFLQRTVLTTSVPGPISSSFPIDFHLEQNYPNPFNPSTTIKFELPRTSQVNLTVFDILGRDVSVLVNERKEAGVYEVKFDGSNLASTVYFYRLQAGDFVQTKKLIILR